MIKAQIKLWRTQKSYGNTNLGERLHRSFRKALFYCKYQNVNSVFSRGKYVDSSSLCVSIELKSYKNMSVTRGYSHKLYRVRAALKGIVFEAFWSAIENRLCLFWFEIEKVCELWTTITYDS